MSALTFAEFAEANRTRCRRWHDPASEPWTGADWSNAMCGEAGEAANVVKKLRRQETFTARGPDDPDASVLRSMLVAQATAGKFNRVSVRQGFPERVQP